MAHVGVAKGMFGIVGLLIEYPSSGHHLSALAETLLRTGATPMFNKAERETLASYVSFLNQCVFCSESHAAVADVHWGSPMAKSVWESPGDAPISDCFRALLIIAERVQRDGKLITQVDIDRARKFGASDMDIHDAVLIASAFCMYNRYVDGLGTEQPRRSDPHYTEVGKMLARQGYLGPG